MFTARGSLVDVVQSWSAASYRLTLKCQEKIDNEGIRKKPVHFVVSQLQVLAFCTENPVFPVRILIERFFPVEIFRKKAIPYEMLLFSGFSLTTQSFCNILIYQYFVHGTTQSYSCFWCEIKYR